MIVIENVNVWSNTLQVEVYKYVEMDLRVFSCES
nr:MAG TPA_asm: hypothetical protein [Caudoviricetes sp.]